LNVSRRIDSVTTKVVSAEVPKGAVGLADLERWSSRGARVQVEGPGRLPEDPVSFVVSFVLIGVTLMLVARLRAGAMSGSKKFDKVAEDRQLTLADVGGAKEARADLQDVISFLKSPARFKKMGARCPAGVLLVGPPGTGKTLLARAVAGEAGVPVIVASGSEFGEMYVGVGARRVRDLASKARAHGRCIIFIDEFDSIGGKRGRPNRTSEEDLTLNQLLVEMDGMAGSEGIVWMAATNREDMLDPAVRRPGRFDRVVEVGMPTAADRLEILRVHAAKRPLDKDVDLQQLSTLTVGYSGAELANLLNEAAIIAVHEECAAITRAHLDQARDKILLGRVRAGVVVSDEERRLIALHEAGHAVVGIVTCPEDRLHKVTIEPRGRSLGAAHFAPDTDRHLHSRRYLEGVIAKALGGRAAEMVFLGPDRVTSGAGNDLVQATSVAHRMVAEFGMSEEVGLVSADASAHNGAVSAQLQSEIDKAVRALIAQQMSRAESIVREHAAALDSIARALVERGVLMAEEVLAIAEQHGVPLRQSYERPVEPEMVVELH
ncbi:MAG TPA: AAA family ATPase, partial [Gemmatimonadaceae bacterium]|nr:AAA family ATPase [Gemmatimonadaceae bacterium]